MRHDFNKLKLPTQNLFWKKSIQTVQFQAMNKLTNKSKQTENAQTKPDCSNTVKQISNLLTAFEQLKAPTITAAQNSPRHHNIKSHIIVSGTKGSWKVVALLETLQYFLPIITDRDRVYVHMVYR